MDPFRDGFLVVDGHHNCVFWVSPDGQVSETIAFDNIVPTRREVHGNTVYVAEAGLNPHLPQNGKVVTFGLRPLSPTGVAFSAPLLIDMKYSLGQTLYALAQGDFEVGLPDGSPAMSNTGSLVEINQDGTFTVVADGLSQSTSVEFIGNTAYDVTLGGEIWKIDNV